MVSEPVTRRRWIDVLLGTSGAAWAAAVVYPVIRYLTPSRDGGGANKATLTDAQKQELAASGYSIVALGTERVLVLKDPQGKLRASSAKCTHEGCTVQYKADESIIWCACHNGRYDLDGRVLSGPPPRALAMYKASGTLATKVVISRETAQG